MRVWSFVRRISASVVFFTIWTDRSTAECLGLKGTPPNNQWIFQLCKNSSKDSCSSYKFSGSTLGRESSDKTRCKPAHEFLKQFSAGLNRTNQFVRNKNLNLHFDSWIPLIWIVAVMATVGNVVTISHSSSLLRKHFHVMPKAQKVYHLLIINLAMADLLMGVYLISMLILDLDKDIPCSSGECRHWQTGTGCSIMGVFSFVSSEVSVTTLISITTCRLFSITWPFKTIQIRPVVVINLLAWFLWTVIACLPVVKSDAFYNTFHNSMFVLDRCPDIPFEARYNEWTTVLETILDQVNCSARMPGHRSWKHLKGLMENMDMFNSSDLRTIGFYQEMPTCGINVIALQNDPSRGLSLLVFSFNLLAFVYMAIAYGCICWKTKSVSRMCASRFSCLGCTPRERSRRSSENKKMRLRMFLIVLTDFACWVPMSLFIIIRAIDDQILAQSEETIIHMTVILFPVNSALNPLLYSARWTKFCKRICKRSLTKHHKEANPNEDVELQKRNTDNNGM